MRYWAEDLANWLDSHVEQNIWDKKITDLLYLECMKIRDERTSDANVSFLGEQLSLDIKLLNNYLPGKEALLLVVWKDFPTYPKSQVEGNLIQGAPEFLNMLINDEDSGRNDFVRQVFPQMHQEKKFATVITLFDYAFDPKSINRAKIGMIAAKLFNAMTLKQREELQRRLRQSGRKDFDREFMRFLSIYGQVNRSFSGAVADQI